MAIFRIELPCMPNEVRVWLKCTVVFSTSLLNIRLMYFWSASWNFLDIVRRSQCSTVWLCFRVVLWSASFQVASEIHISFPRALYIGLLESFCRSSEVASSQNIWPLFGVAIGQEALLLWCFIFFRSPHSLIFSKTIRWSINNFGSLMQTLYKYLSPFL